MSKWYDQIVDAAKPKTAPRDAVTSVGFAQKAGISLDVAKHRLLELFRRGDLDRVRIGNTFHYFPKK